ncbi:MAG: CRISPR-associated helicase Cas3' [Gammaproteobacteria bacterium]|nr:CRISPR-associated helicase Cas3' [Gammaproteobacteria bacterium]MDE0260014.1 CRISPR-associated helicase Cas3' [Gammaproteobacteria bacterium]
MKPPGDRPRSSEQPAGGSAGDIGEKGHSATEDGEWDRLNGPTSLGPIAHSENETGRTHDLVAHLRSVSELACEFAREFGGHHLAKYLGMWHDLGKFHPDWQAYVHASRGAGAPDHKWAGTRMAAHWAGSAALVVHGHHGGLKSLARVRSFLSDEALQERGCEALALAPRFIPDLEPSEDLGLVPHYATRSHIHLEFFLRMVFSCLVDADYLDTENHFRPRGWQPGEARGEITALRDVLDSHCRVRFSGASGTVNECRRAIREDCLRAATGAPGRYSLTAPTGSGKTLSVMGFALEHAALRGMDRVIYAAPFISVTSQTAEEFRSALEGGAEAVYPTERTAETLRDALGEGVVLEHHSNAPWRSEEAAGTPWARWSELSSENWDAPVVVTTTVQLLESLFSNRPGRCRKNHRMANAVIVLDEAQSIPRHVTVPSIDALRSLTDDYGSTVVLATATQPAFESIPGIERFDPTEIVDRVEEHFDTLRRVSYRWNHREERSWSEIAFEMMAAPRGTALGIVNTRGHARLLLEALRAAQAPDPMLLSTRLCSRHRRRVEEMVRQRLKRGEPCLLVSTQIVEAGVDLDFPAVWREFAPLPSVVQAAGRCNREGNMEDLGTVTVFRTPDTWAAADAVYGPAIGQTEKIVSSHDFACDRPETAMAGYFRELYGLLAPGNGLDRCSIQDRRSNGNFPYDEIAKDFRLIEDDQFPVVITNFERGDEVRGWLQYLDNMAEGPATPDPTKARRLRRRLQPYLVDLGHRDFERARADGMTGERGSASGFPEWTGPYDATAGLVLDEPNARRRL